MPDASGDPTREDIVALAEKLYARDVYADRQHKLFALFVEVGAWRITTVLLRSLPRIGRLLLRARRMPARWAFWGYEAHLDTPVATLRQRLGVRVRQLIAAFESVVGKPVPVREAPPRPGDAVGAYANVDLARRLLRWEAELSVEEAIASALAWADKRREVLGYE